MKGKMQRGVCGPPLGSSISGRAQKATAGAPRRVLTRKKCASSDRKPLEDANVLVRSAVTGPVRIRYHKLLNDFLTFAGLKDLRRCDVTTLDGLLVDYLTECYENGRAANHGDQLLAAVEHACPYFSRRGQKRLERSLRAVAGWRKLRPAQSRPPHAFAELCGVAVWLMAAGLRDMSLLVIVGTACYMRPSELLSLRGCDLAPPMGPTVPFWSLLIKPFELLKPTKN
eukprot:6354666-Amphidinium_carterae.1